MWDETRVESGDVSRPFQAAGVVANRSGVRIRSGEVPTGISKFGLKYRFWTQIPILRMVSLVHLTEALVDERGPGTLLDTGFNTSIIP